jgi:hypothetical protein
MGKTHMAFYLDCISPRSDTPCRLILKLHDENGNLVAHSLLPYKFIVIANGNHTGSSANDCGPRVRTAAAAARQQVPRAGFPLPNPSPMPILDARSPEPPAGFRPISVNQQPQLDSNYPAPVLQRLAPAEGPTSGGPTILLSGINFPQPPQQMVYARFGAVAVPTV